ncbi:protein-tyrosine kinase 6-like isoform X1 [Hypomesus transpacificus]|uniref:protein-tyrosine kinase 6-like isoform X1 n=1 Tax=Hypomesus transpacificus TaxID=137520 RepID=UPI001F07E705|nr:protein-tyrosine kinase 6-like isoform X1 [Hypomesus transpacificus]
MAGKYWCTSCSCVEMIRDGLFGKKNNHQGNKGTGNENDADEPVDLDNGSAIQYKVHREALKPPKASESGMYKALWSFDARADDEVTFKEGELFKIISRNGDWWTAQKIDKNGICLVTGIVPKHYLVRGESVEAQPWYFGKMDRFEAMNHLLSPENAKGAFLIRLSEKDSVGHVLSVKSDKQVKHFKVVEEGGRFHLNQTQSFCTLMDLVEFYSTNNLGSLLRLGEPCAKSEPKPKDLSHSTVDEWELPKEEFSLEEKLGSGYFADVFRGQWKTLINVAVKILKNDELNHKEFQLEVQMMKKLRHRHLISLFAVCTATPPYYIITELMEKGNLLDFLRGEEGSCMDLVSLVDMAAQVADGMAYLEEQQSIHRDLAARNVLVGENNICKVADFGLARVIKEPFYISEEKKIPFKWSAPEAISHGKFSNKSDVWSFGILLYEILSYGSVPYPAFSNLEVYSQVFNGYRMPAPPKCPDILYDIMLSCWKDFPSDRPDFKDLSPWLESINLNEVE